MSKAELWDTLTLFLSKKNCVWKNYCFRSLPLKSNQNCTSVAWCCSCSTRRPKFVENCTLERTDNDWKTVAPSNAHKHPRCFSVASKFPSTFSNRHLRRGSPFALALVRKDCVSTCSSRQCSFEGGIKQSKFGFGVSLSLSLPPCFLNRLVWLVIRADMGVFRKQRAHFAFSER